MSRLQHTTVTHIHPHLQIKYTNYVSKDKNTKNGIK